MVENLNKEIERDFDLISKIIWVTWTQVSLNSPEHRQHILNSLYVKQVRINSNSLIETHLVLENWSVFEIWKCKILQLLKSSFMI